MENAVFEKYEIDGRCPSDRTDQWETVLSDAYIPFALRAAPGPEVRRERLTRTEVDDLTLIDLACGPCTVALTPSRISRATSDQVVVLVAQAGGERASVGNTNALLGAGRVFIWDCLEPARFEIDSFLEKRNLLIPREVFAEATMRHSFSGGIELDGTTGPVRLLIEYLELLKSSMPHLAEASAVSARNATVDLINGALRSVASVPASDGNAAMLFSVMNRWITRQLPHGDITPAQIADAHSVSVRTVHRVFAQAGETVGGVVRKRRLEQVRRDLETTDAPISAIAARWRFSDASHLTRTFRQSLGITPSDYRASTRTSQVASAG